MSDYPEKELAAFIGDLSKLVKDAYDRGYMAGGLAMRDSIIQAANAPMAMRPGSVSMAIQVTEGGGSVSGNIFGSGPPLPLRIVPAAPIPVKRAPKGLVPSTIRRALEDKPGSTVTEVIKWAALLEPAVARASIGNELRRFEGKLYERDRPNGKRWFLIGQKESAGKSSTTSPADNFNPQTKGGEAT